MGQIPTITRNLLIINILAYLAAVVLGMRGIDLNDMFGLHFFLASDFHVYQLVTYMFMHGGVSHLFFNMFALWMFGCTLERTWGEKRFLFFTLACGLGAGLFQECVQSIKFFADDLYLSDYVNYSGMIMPMGQYLNMWNTVGFSGAVYGILLGFGMTFPEERIFVFPLPVPIKGKWFVCIYASIELFMAMQSSSDGIAHMAHLGGMAIGYVIIRYWKYQYSRGRWDGYEVGSRTSVFTRVKEYIYNIRYKFKRDHSSKKNNTSGEGNQTEIDRILEKIKRSGYGSLTDEERRKLFDRR